MRDVRLFFTKTGLSRYISHLDLMRCLSRALRRSGLPVWCTQGFNPHIYLSFSLPLPLGTESVCESADFRLEGETPLDEVKERLNGVLPEGVRVLRAAEPLHRPTELAFARYLLTLYGGDAPELCRKIKEILSLPSLPAQKKAKRGRGRVYKEIDLREHIREFSVCADGERVELTVVLTAGGRDNINPSLLLDVFKEEKIAVSDFEILREKLCLADMTEFC